MADYTPTSIHNPAFQYSSGILGVHVVYHYATAKCSNAVCMFVVVTVWVPIL